MSYKLSTNLIIILPTKRILISNDNAGLQGVFVQSETESENLIAGRHVGRKEKLSKLGFKYLIIISIAKDTL